MCIKIRVLAPFPCKMDQSLGIWKALTMCQNASFGRGTQFLILSMTPKLSQSPSSPASHMHTSWSGWSNFVRTTFLCRYMENSEQWHCAQNDTRVVCNSQCIIHHLNEIIFVAFLHCIITSIYLLNVSIPNANALQCLYVYSALINCPVHFQNRQSSIVKCSYALQFINYSYFVSTKVLLTSLLLH